MGTAFFGCERRFMRRRGDAIFIRVDKDGGGSREGAMTLNASGRRAKGKCFRRPLGYSEKDAA
jgi:hypothetical protein